MAINYIRNITPFLPASCHFTCLSSFFLILLLLFYFFLSCVLKIPVLSFLPSIFPFYQTSKQLVAKIHILQFIRSLSIQTANPSTKNRKWKLYLFGKKCEQEQTERIQSSINKSWVEVKTDENWQKKTHKYKWLPNSKKCYFTLCV